MTDYPIRILSGLPAIARVTHYVPHTNATYWAPADGPEMEFEILDAKGRPAPWITRRLDAAAMADIEAELLTRLYEEARDD